MLRKIRNKLYKKGGRLIGKVCPEIEEVVARQRELLAGSETEIKNSTALLRATQQILELLRAFDPQKRTTQKTALSGEILADSALREAIDELGKMSASQRDLLYQVVRGQKELETRLEEIQGDILQLKKGRPVTLSAPVSEPAATSNSYLSRNPETALLVHLLPLLPNRVAIDVGAHRGQFAGALLDGGYEVHAFEPNPKVFAELEKKLHGRSQFHAHAMAIGSVEEKGSLHLATFISGGGQGETQDATLFSSLLKHDMPENLAFSGEIPCEISSLKALQIKGLLPKEASVLKIDTEGYELEVIRGMDDSRYNVVMAEFWDEKIPFGRSRTQNKLVDMTTEMRQRGYGWQIVFFRLWSSEKVSFYCNADQTVENSWGNVLFFNNPDLFRAAQEWAVSALPETRFVSV